MHKLLLLKMTVICHILILIQPEEPGGEDINTKSQGKHKFSASEWPQLSLLHQAPDGSL